MPDWRLALQDPVHPAEIRQALHEVGACAKTRLRVGVAYITSSGSELLVDIMKLRAPWDAIDKTILTSFDFNNTDPDALEFLAGQPNSEVRISTAHLGKPGNYHPKLYLADGPNVQCGLVASANVSRPAFTVSTEAGTLVRSVTPIEALETYWEALVANSVELTPVMLAEYRRRRAGAPPPPVDEQVRPVAPSAAAGSTILADAVDAGIADMATARAFWIEAGSMSSGGSHNQLELPRSANRFFGYHFTAYHDDHAVIGHPTLIARGATYDDRPLTWHGNNRMERINLPTITQGGFDYQNTAVLFRRTADGFVIDVAPWDSATAVAWRNASALIGQTFKLGATSPRSCGVF